MLGCVRKWVCAALVSLVMLMAKAESMLTVTTVAFGSQSLAHWLEVTELTRDRDEWGFCGACAFPAKDVRKSTGCVGGCGYYVPRNHLHLVSVGEHSVPCWLSKTLFRSKG